jgi:hypothetical protein
VTAVKWLLNGNKENFCSLPLSQLFQRSIPSLIPIYGLWNHALPPYSCYVYPVRGVYKSFIERKKLGICEKEKPMFRGRVIWLDDHLFKLDAENWRVSIAIHEGGWVALRLLHGRYHDRFKGARPGEAQLVLEGGWQQERGDDGFTIVKRNPRLQGKTTSTINFQDNPDAQQDYREDLHGPY